VCRQFIVLCRELNVFSQALVAIDGSKFKAVNNRDKNFTAAKMQRRMASINESIERYLTSMDTADRAEPEVAALKKGRLQDKIQALKQQMEQLKGIEAQMNASHEVINEGTDRDQLATMAEQAKHALGTEELTVVAERGYFKGERILECENAGITALLPKSITSNSRAEGRFEKQDFIYVAADDEYRCPAGERAIWRMTTIEHG